MMKRLHSKNQPSSNSRKETVSENVLTSSSSFSHVGALRVFSRGKFRTLIPKAFGTAFLILISLSWMGSVWGQAQSSSYTTAGTQYWLCPAGVTSITVKCYGGGGGGGRRTTNGVTGGGGGGAYASKINVAVTPGTIYTVVVGAGGAGANPATAGGDSYFNTASTVMAKGGSAVANNSATGANGGQAANCVGDVGSVFSGGTGGTGSGTNAGKGGGGAGTGGAGGNGGTGSTNGAGTAVGGGNGGNGRTATQGAGSSGSTYGGGGGGAYRNGTSYNGGAGAAGAVIIEWTGGAYVAPSSVNMSTGSSTLTSGIVFYDSGGSGSAYVANESYTYTFYPASCKYLTATFSAFAAESTYDFLYVYNGNSVSEPLLGSYSTMSVPTTFTSTASDGSLTFKFTSDGSTQGAGWTAILNNVSVVTGPAQPSSIVGTLDPEVGATETYSVTNVSGVSYAWSFPSGWVVNSGAATNSVSVTVGSTNGTISVTPSKCSLNGTARTATTTIPNYRWKYISSNLGSATWTGGEARNVDITIKNTGVSTWNSGVTTNVAIRWDSDNSNAVFSPWSDYHSRVTAGTVAPGSQTTYTLSIEAKNATSGGGSSPSYSTNLADGTYYLAFDLVNESSCWFGGPAGGTGACTTGNTPWYSAAQTVSTVPTLSCSALTAFGNVCTNTTPTNSFTISGVNLTNSVSVGSVTGYTYSTASNGSYTSTLTLTPSSGSLNQTVYVKFTPTAATAYSGSISVTSTGATGQSVSVSGTGITAPTVNAGSDFNMCSGQTVAMSGSTNATSSSGTASSGTVTASGNDNTNPTATYTFTGLPSGAVINGITVNITSAGGGNCPSWYSVTTRLNGVQQGVAGCATNTTYTNLNGQAANGLVIDVRGQDNDAYADAMTITYTVSLSYYVGVSPNPIYAWSPATGLSATNILTPDCSAISSNTYTLTVTGTNGCSASDAVAVTVAGSAPSAPTASVSGSSTINLGGTTTLTSSAGANTLWYEAATLGSSVGSGDNWQTPVQCVSGTKIYYAEDNNGTCASATRTAVTFTVRPMVVSNPANGLICQAGGSVTLSAQLTGGSSISWSPNTNLSTTSGASTVASPTATTQYTMTASVAGCPGSVSAQQTVGVIDALAFTPTSTPTAVCAGNTAALASNLSSSGFSALSTTFAMASSSSATPSAAVTLASGGTAIVPTTSTLTALRPLDDAGWANIPIGFEYNFFGNNYTTLNVGTNGNVQFGTYNGSDVGGLGDFQFSNLPNTSEPANIIAAAAVDLNATAGTIKYWTQGIAPTRVFVVEWSGVPGYASNGSNTAQIKLFETTGNVETHIQNSSSSSNKIVGLQNNTIDPNTSSYTGAMPFSNTTTITNQAWKFVPGAAYTFQWATAGSNIDGATSTGYTTPTLSTAGTVSYSVAATNPNTQCITTQSVEITVNALPAAPNSSGDVTACGNAGSQSLTVTTGTGVTADWYSTSSASTSPTILASGDNVLSYSTATAGTYYAEAQNTTTGCTSASRTGVTLNVNASPDAPTVTTPVSYCQGTPATTLTATPTGSNTLNWYSAAPNSPSVSGATALGSAPTPSTTTAGPTTYYVSQSSSSNNCESQLASITVTVNATPSTPVASNPAAYCEGAPASALTATSTVGNTLYWYTHPTTNAGQTSTAPTPSTATSGTTDYYVANRNNTSSCEGSRATVTVTVNPTITASVSNSASSTSACGGGEITFTATPTNGGTPTYQWYLNNQPVGTNSATYTLATPNNADAIYVAMTPSAQTCLASVAATNSNTVSLTAAAATPTVSIQSSATSAFCPGTPVTFSVNASANMGASPGYQWNLNGQPIIGATNATLTTTTLENTNQVSLTMTSSLSGGCLTQSNATSSAITSTVNSATVISVPPAAASACLGGTTSFTVSATGTGTLTYQWKKNGSNVNANASATTSTLTLSGIAAGDAANYTVDVIGTCGTVSSTAAALSINSATAISAQPSAVVQCSGTTANFSVTASGQGTLSYQWKKDGSNVGTNSSTLSITNIALANAGQYSVIVTGGCGNVPSSNALLTVNSSTAISTQPVASTLCAGNTVNFSVTASGTGTLSYQWKKDGTNVGTNSSSLSIANTQAANAGTYTVDVIGSCGTLTSNNALLTINPLTTISTQPVGTAGCEGQNTTFTVVAAGTGTLSYQWKYGSTNVGTNSTSYNIPSTTTANDGNYSVVVTGGCGNATSSTVALNVYASPTTNATISTADITDATLCGKNQVTISANSPAESTGEWTVVGNWGILPESDTDPVTTFTANNAALGGTSKQLVWSHIRTTDGNSCYTRDTITVDFKQPTITSISGVIQNGDVVWGGLTSSAWSTSDNWYQYQSGALIRMTQGEPTASTKVFTLSNSAAGACVSSSNVPAIGNGEAASNVYVGNGATLNLSSGTLTIAGDLTNNGTISPSSGTITFNGTGAQKITGTGTVANFNNLVVNKATGTLTLEQPAKVAGTLTMTQGDIITDATNILEVGTNASSVGSVSWTAGTVRGPMKRWFAGTAAGTTESGIFPVGVQSGGKAGTNRYAQVNFSSNPGTGGYIVAEYKTGTPGNNYSGLPLNYSSGSYPQAIQNAEEEGYWDITPYSAGNVPYAALNSTPYTLKVRLQNPSTLTNGWTPSNDGNDLYNASTVRLIRSKGSTGHASWELAGTHVSATETGNGDYFITSSGITEFSWFNGGGNNQNPLPVELVSFTGACDDGVVSLTWQTASEFNSSHFDVEKSRDGENWQLLTKISSAGTSNELITYQSTDQNGTEGNNYFRLRQVDNDGKEKLYDPINVSCAEVTTGYFSSFPNPSGSAFQVIVNNKELTGACTLNMVDATGKVIEQREIEVKDGINMFVVNQELTPGIYFLNISNGSKSTAVLRHAIK